MQPTVREQQRIKTRSDLLRLAAEEFDQRGYADVALSDIAARQEVTKGTLYFHFSSKAKLASAVVEHYFTAWEGLIADVKKRNLQGISALRWLLSEVARQYRDDPGVRAPLRLMRESNIIGIDLPTPFLLWIDTVKTHLHEALDQGEVRSDIDINNTAWQVVAGFFGVQEISHQLTARSDIVERVDMMWELLLTGITTRS